MIHNTKHKNTVSNSVSPEGSLRSKKFSRWMKKLVQPTQSEHSKQHIKSTIIDREKNLQNSKNTHIKVSGSNMLLHKDSELLEDGASDNFSVQGMCSIKPANLGKKQGLSLTRYSSNEDENEQKHMFNKSCFVDKDISFANIDAESRYSATLSARAPSYNDCQESKTDEPSRFSDKNSIISDGIASVSGQETINSSLVGIPPQSILDNGRFNNVNTSSRLPHVTPSLASQSVKNYKVFPKATSTQNSEQHSSDNHTIISLFSGVGTTTSHFNYFYDRNNEVRSDTNSESNSYINDRFSV